MQPEDLSFAGSERRIVEEWLQTEQSETLAADPFEHRASLKSLLELTVFEDSDGGLGSLCPS